MAKKITYRGPNAVEAIAVGISFRPGQTLEVTDDEAALLLTNHLFVDESGKNPAVTCVRCGDERFATGVFRSGGIAPLVDADDKPICEPCFTKAATPAAEPPPPAAAPAAPLAPVTAATASPVTQEAAVPQES